MKKRRSLFLDDYLVLCAMASLIAQTACTYTSLDLIFTETVLSTDPMNIVLFTRGQVLDLADNFLKWSNILQALGWTTLYLIKVSFLAFFKVLTRDVSRGLTIYWWFVLCVTVASWMFVAFENMILCGANHSCKCIAAGLKNDKSLTLSE